MEASAPAGRPLSLAALILLGLGLGVGATLSPGPLSALVLTTTLQRGFGAGSRVAIAPLITDLPFILLTLLLTSVLPARLLSAVGIVGGAFVVYLGVQTVIQAHTAQFATGSGANASFRDVLRGAAVNVLSPNPWIFIVTVLDPQLVLAWRRLGSIALVFPIAFYFALVGGKLALALLVASVRQRFALDRYRQLLTVAGILLMLFGTILGLNGVRGVVG